MPATPSTRSASTNEVRESTARAVAFADVSTEPIVSLSTTSRTPRPAGAMMTTNPAAHARAKAPIDCTSTRTEPSGEIGPASTATWTPNSTYAAADAATAPAIARSPGKPTTS